MLGANIHINKSPHWNALSYNKYELPCIVKNINTLSHTKAPQANRTFSEIKYAKNYSMRVCVH